jgi:molecular chaperone GrpE
VSAAAASGEAGAIPSSPEERVAALEAARLEMRDRMLRIAAEFENWKKRARREQGESEGRGKEAVLRDMLEVIDNLERATTAWGDSADATSVRQGVDLVLRMFQAKLERHDVRPIESAGRPFDPRVHDAVSQIPSAEAAGTVIGELQRGYRIGERLLRPASVVVAVALPSAAASEGQAPTTTERVEGEAESTESTARSSEDGRPHRSETPE